MVFEQIDTSCPKVSIGVISYNDEAFIEECLDSIRLQNYPNLEVFVSEDASSDNSFKKIQEYDQKHPGFITGLYSQPENLGISRHCNFLIDKMSGDYIEIFSGDDIMLPGKLKKQVEVMEQNSKAALCFTNMEWFRSESGRKICNHFGFLQKPSTRLADAIADFHIPTPTLLVRRSLLDDIRYSTDLTYINDFYYVVELMQQGSALYLPDITVRYRKHKNSATLKNYFYKDRLKIVEMFRKNLPLSYAAAIEKYEYTVYYAKIMELIQEKKRMGALKLFPHLIPAAFSSPKWCIRSGAIFANLMRFR